jgi:hypothetical protein
LLRILPIIAVGVAVFLGKDAFKENLDVVGKVQNAATSGVEIDAVSDLVMTEFMEEGKLPAEDFSKFLRDNTQVGKGREGRDRSRDPWGTPYRLKVVLHGYEVLSAGPDAHWDTPDDLKSSRSLKEVPGGLAVTPEAYEKKEKNVAVVSSAKQVAPVRPATAAPPKQSDEETQLKLLNFQKRQAESGSAYAQYEMGLRYLEGRGVDQDPVTGRDWLEKSAKNGNADAAHKLQMLDAAAKK